MQTSNILFTHGYFLYEDAKEAQIMRPYIPLGILYLSAFLEKNGFENEVFDSTFTSMQALQQQILLQKPNILAVYVNLMTKLNVLKIIRFVKENEMLRDTKIILGGPEVKYNAAGFLAAGADVLVVGEGEETTLELATLFLTEKENSNPESLANITGIAYFSPEKEVIFTPERAKLKDIDVLPPPNRHKVNLHLYLDAWKKHHGKNAISVSTMRGCPYTCKWCSRAVYGLSYRRTSAAKVVAELQTIQDTYQPDSLWFVDDVFTISHKWLREFADELAKKNLKIPYECITRADRMNEEVIDLLKETGCFRVWIGAESGSQKVIDLMDRRVDVNKVRDMIRLSEEKGIEAGTFIMLGYPGETQADIEETVHHLKSANPSHFTITVAYPIKGTELFQEVENEQTHVIDWEAATDRDRDFKRTYPRPYYDFAVRYVVNEVNFYKKKLQKKALSPKAIGFKMRAWAAKTGMLWIKNRDTFFRYKN